MMRQETENSYKWKESFTDDFYFHLKRSSMDSQVEILSQKVGYCTSSASSTCSENSTLSFDSGLEKSCTEINSNYSKYSMKKMKRKISTESNTSTADSANSSLDDGHYEQQNYPDDLSIINDKLDNVIEAIGGLKLSRNQSIDDFNDLNIKSPDDDDNVDDDDDDDDDDLQERGPVRPQMNYPRQKPYYSCNYYDNQTDEGQTDIDSTAKEILSNLQYSYVINASLDKLTDCNNPSQKNLINNGWSGNNLMSQFNNKTIEVKNDSLPKIVFDEKPQSLIDILHGLQPAQKDTINYQNSSPSTSSENWPDSPSSNYQQLTSNSQSCTSSRPHTPGSLINIDSPNISISQSCSPPRQRQLNNNYYRTRPQSSSSSSNYSLCDTPSPINYQNLIDNQIDEEQLGINFGNFSTWCESCESTGTIINQSTDYLNNKLNITNNIIDNNDDNILNNNNNNQWDIKYLKQIKINRCKDYNNHCNNNNNNLSTICNYHINDNYIGQNNNNNNNNNIVNSELNNFNYDNSLNDLENFITNQIDNNSDDVILDLETKMEDLIQPNYSQNNSVNNHYNIINNTDLLNNDNYHNSCTQINDNHTIELPKNIWCQDDDKQQQKQQQQQQQWNDKNDNKIFNDFQKPIQQKQYKLTSKKRKNSLKKLNPWKSLNMPKILSSKILKSKLDDNDVEKAMKYLLKKTTDELLKVDEDGDTILMCLVGNPIELKKKKEFLIPLVERLSVTHDGLTKINKRGENALYLAAINCPEMYYVAGYLGGVMIDRGIDISLPNHTKGNNLIHELVKNGESHKSVLSELLSLKTNQGKSVFDLSKCNYDGKTPLHIAVEAHKPHENGINTISIIRLLIDNGCDCKIREFKCGNTALNIAVSLSCDPTLVQVLLEKCGCDAVNIPNRNNNTPLHMVAALSEKLSLNIQSDICMQLIKAGACTNIQNNHGQLPLTLVVTERKEFIRKIFHNKS